MFVTNKNIGFKLLSLELMGNSLMGKAKIFYNFVDSNDSQDSLYTTVIIGANGTGKSNLFRIIIELFKELHDLSVEKKRSYTVDGLFSLVYSLNGDYYEYSNIPLNRSLDNFDDIDENEKGDVLKLNRAYLKINGEIRNFSEAFFPLSIVANSIMLTDKFPFYKKEIDRRGILAEQFPIYKYLGVRHIAQGASTRAYVRRTIEFIVTQFEKTGSDKIGFQHSLRKATDFLELDNSIEIFYRTYNNSIFFRGDLTPMKLDSFFKPIAEKYSRPESIPPFKLNHYVKIKNDKNLVETICDFCNELSGDGSLQKVPYINSTRRMISFNLLDDKSFKKLNDSYVMLEHLRQLGIITSPDIYLKRQDGYSLQESSSGEYHFFSSIIGLLATVKSTNSLILIDEPEISLHPNWQMKYLSFIRELFSFPEYKTCHVIIATHSHFLISDLKGSDSKIIGLKRVDRKLQIVDLPKNIDTFGWSAEDVLYNIFNVRSSLNYYLEADLTELLGMIANNIHDKDKLNTILDKLLELPKRENDPLQEIILEAQDYLKSIE